MMLPVCFADCRIFSDFSSPTCPALLLLLFMLLLLLPLFGIKRYCCWLGFGCACKRMSRQG
jgi:hypothetical protein